MVLRWGRSEGEADGGPPDGPLMLGGLQQASVVGHDLVLGQVQVELQRHQHGELEGNQLPPVHSEALLQFLRGGGKEELQKQIQALFFSFKERFISRGVCARGNSCLAEIWLKPLRR